MAHLRRDVVVVKKEIAVANDVQQAPAGIGAVDAFFDGVFAPLERWIPELVERFEALDGKITGAQLSALVEAGSYVVLDSTDRPLYGAGFCGSDALVSEGNPLAWWQGPDRQLLATSTFGPGQAAIDLERLEWYRVPLQTGEAHVAGPFVDYLCSNEITLTSTLPLYVRGEFYGVACADVLVSSVEELLLPSIGNVEGAALVNLNGRVVVSTDPELETGDRYEGLDFAAGSTPDGRMQIVSSDRYPFALVTPK